MAKLSFETTHSDNTTQNVTSTVSEENSETVDIMMIIHSLIASVGIVGNWTVMVAFLNHKRFRNKIPNIFIINQVSYNTNLVKIRKR